MTGSSAYILSGSSIEVLEEKIKNLPKAFIPQGTLTFAKLPAQPIADNLGYIWNISDAFTTDSRFIEGAGKKVAAGNNVGVIKHDNKYYYDVMAGVDLSNYYTKVEVDDKINIEKLARETADTALQNGKLDIMPGDEHTAGNAYNLPYFFKTSADANKVTVTAETVSLDGNKTYGSYSLDVPAATATTAGLMSATDKAIVDSVDYKIEMEAINRADADTLIRSDLDSEVSARTNGDNALQESINQESITREEADTTLQTNIDKKQDILVSGTNIKTVNGGSIVGSGNLEVKTYLPFPNGTLRGTLQEVVSAILAFPSRAQGMAYLGGIAGSCTPFGYGNVECTVTFMTNSIAVLSASSSNIAPYHWEYNTAQSDYKWRKYSDVSASATGSSTTEVKYIKIDGTEYKLASGANYTAGDNIQINNNVISATDTKYTAGENITISTDNVISATGSGTAYTAGKNITITDNTIAANAESITLTGTSGTLTDEQLAVISDNTDAYISLNGKSFRFSNVVAGKAIIATYINSAGTTNEAISIDIINKTWNYSQSELQSKLTAGDNITIDSNVITATDTKYTAGNNIVIDADNKISANVRTYRPLKASWKQSSTAGGLTLAEFCNAINADSSVAEGDAYCGNITSNNFFKGMYFEDAANPLNSAEVNVQVMGSWGTGHVMLLTVTSSNHAPYFWQYTWVDGLASWVSWSDIRKLDSTTSTKELQALSLNGTEYKLSAKPDAYLKSASITDNTLTLTNKDDTTVEYTPDIFMPFPDDFVTGGTTVEFATSVVNHSTFKAGKAWYGSLNCSDLPNGLMNVECTVKALPNRIAVIELSSANRGPYKWEYNTASAWPGNESHSDWKLVLTAQTRALPTDSGFYNIQINRDLNGGYTTTAAKALPNMPTEDGDYKLRISGGIASWVKES